MRKLRLRMLLVLSLTGAAIAGYLTLFQLGVVTTVWDPVFGDGTARVLGSVPARALPVPDALLGVVGYGVEAALLVAARPTGALGRRRATLLLGALAAAMAVASLGLVALQAVVVGAWCTLCLASAAVSWIIAIVAIPEVVSTLRAAVPAADSRFDGALHAHGPSSVLGSLHR